MREMSPEQFASGTMVLLPFELEYLLEKTDVAVTVDDFNTWPLEISPGLIIQVGRVDLQKPCPFLQPNFYCRVYEHRPLDCWSFPLIPIIDPINGQPTLQYGPNCPSLSTLNPAFEAQLRSIWAEVFHVLPLKWVVQYQSYF